MKLIYSLALSSILLLGLPACHKDHFDPGTVIDPPNDPEVHIEKESNGRVMDIEGEALNPDALLFNGKNLSVDEDGFFNTKSFIPIDQLTILSQKEGYFDAIYAEPIAESGFDYFQIIHYKKDNPVILSSENDFLLSQNGMEIHLKANNYLREDGSSYTGSLIVNIHYYDPNELLNYQNFPFQAKTRDGKHLKQMAGFVFELKNTAGEKISLASDIEMHISGSNAFNQLNPNAQLWYFDIQKSAWTKLSDTHIQSNKYLIQNNKTGFFAIGENYDAIIYEADIQSSNFGSIRSLKIENKSDYFVSILRPNAQLKMRQFIPKNSTLLMSLLDQCNTLLAQSNIISSNSDLKNSRLEVNDDRIHTIEGRLVDCNNNVVTNAYLTLKDDNGASYEIIKTDKLGRFKIINDLCDLQQIQLYGANQSNGSIGSTYHFENAKKIKIGDLKICNEAPMSNRITLQFEDEVRVINDGVQIIKDSSFPTIHVKFKDSYTINDYVEYQFDLSKTAAANKYDFNFIFSNRVNNPDFQIIKFECPNVQVQRWGINQGESIEATVKACKLALYPETTTNGKHKGTIRIEGLIE